MVDAGQDEQQRLQEKLKTLLRDFRGRKVSSKEHTNTKGHKLTDIAGDYLVLCPKKDPNLNDLRVALKVAELTDAKVFVRSGTHPALDGGEDGNGAVVIDMKNFNGVHVERKTRIRVGPSATTSALIKMLSKQKLFLPFAHPAKSIMGNVLSSEPGFFGSSLGLLRDYVEEIRGITTIGRIFVASKTGDAEHVHMWKSILAGRCRCIVTELVLNAEERKLSEVQMMQLSAPYTSEGLALLLELVFGEFTPPGGADIVVRACSSAYGFTVNTLSVVTADSATKSEVQDLVKVAKRRLRDGLALLAGENDLDLDASDIIQGEELMGADILEAIGRTDPDATSLHAPCRMRFRRCVACEEEAGEFFLLGGKFSNTLELLLGGTEESGRHVPHLHTFTTVQLHKSAQGELEALVNLSLFSPRTLCLQVPPQEVKEVLQRIEDLQFARPLVQPAMRVPRIGRPFAPLLKADGPALSIQDVKRAMQEAQEQLVLQSAADPSAGPLGIPAFKGEVYFKGQPNDVEYQESIYQYATTSYEDAAERMSPFVVAYPADAEDVQTAVKFALEQGKKVVARSGGHQYCGLSSGGDDTVLLDMKHLNEISIAGDKDIIATVGPGAQLRDVSRNLCDNQVALPHGECPMVCIGGHFQTGGFGHIMRSFGLNLDHVVAFDIVTTDGKHIKHRTIRKPKEGQQETPDPDARLYWAVLGGGPGSFGIVTQIQYKCIRDVEHPNTVGYSAFIVYEKEVFRAVMEVVKERTRKIKEGDDSLPAGSDMMATVMTYSLTDPFRPVQTLLVEMVHGNPGGKMEEVSRTFFKTEIDRITKARSFWNRLLPPLFNGEKPLSEMNYSFVRVLGMTKDGREFKFPYVKRLNCTNKPLTDEFVEEFVDIVDRVLKEKHVKFVYQMVSGGGNYENHAHLTSIPHRDMVLGIVFDIFYDGDKGYEAARRYQEEIGEILEKNNFHPSEGEMRMTWGSWGDTDMRKAEVQQWYYGQGDLYEKLQLVKKEVDPMDVFHTEFTVQLPSEGEADRWGE